MKLFLHIVLQARFSLMLQRSRHHMVACSCQTALKTWSRSWYMHSCFSGIRRATLRCNCQPFLHNAVVNCETVTDVKETWHAEQTVFPVASLNLWLYTMVIVETWGTLAQGSATTVPRASSEPWGIITGSCRTKSKLLQILWRFMIRYWLQIHLAWRGWNKHHQCWCCSIVHNMLKVCCANDFCFSS